MVNDLALLGYADHEAWTSNRFSSLINFSWSLSYSGTFAASLATFELHKSFPSYLHHNLHTQIYSYRRMYHKYLAYPRLLRIELRSTYFIFACLVLARFGDIVRRGQMKIELIFPRLLNLSADAICRLSWMLSRTQLVIVQMLSSWYFADTTMRIVVPHNFCWDVEMLCGLIKFSLNAIIMRDFLHTR